MVQRYMVPPKPRQYVLSTLVFDSGLSIKAQQNGKAGVKAIKGT